MYHYDQRFYLIGQIMEHGLLDLNLQKYGEISKAQMKISYYRQITVTLLENPVRNVLSVDLDFENSIDHATIGHS